MEQPQSSEVHHFPLDAIPDRMPPRKVRKVRTTVNSDDRVFVGYSLKHRKLVIIFDGVELPFKVVA